MKRFTMNHHPADHGIWFQYNGSRYKDVYDVKLHDGTILNFLHQNGNGWYPDAGNTSKRSVKDSEVAEIRLVTDEDLIGVNSWRETGQGRIEDQIELFGGIANIPEPQKREQ